MFKRYFWLSFLVCLWVVLLPWVVYGLSYEQVSNVAQGITVLIDGCSSGSGVLYQREGNVYSVLTARHVIEDNEGSCLVITPDQNRYKVEESQIFRSQEDVDLAVIQFKSNKSYELAKWGNSKEVKIGTKVYVSGAPQPSEGIPQRVVIVTDGNVVGIQPPQKGYELIYSSATRAGMSGGPVLNKKGEVVGIHGQGDRAGDKLNLGIPIETFLKGKIQPPKPSPSPSVTPKKVPVKIQPPKPSPSSSVTPEKIPVKFLLIVIVGGGF